MNLILLGPSGSGKGVQAKLLVEKFGFDYVVMGDILRASAQTNEEIKNTLQKGELISNDITFGLIKERLGNKAPENILLDGFPRTVEQYRLLAPWLSKVGGNFDLTIVLNISDEEVVKRLSARRMDPVSGKIYNLITDRPPDDIDQSKLLQREDDKPDAVRKRLSWYHKSVEPLIEEMKKDMKVVGVDGERPIDVIHRDLVALIEGETNARG